MKGTDHAASDADFGHAPSLRSRDGRSPLVQHADGRSGQEECLDVPVRVVRDELLQRAKEQVNAQAKIPKRKSVAYDNVFQDGGDDTGRSCVDRRGQVPGPDDRGEDQDGPLVGAVTTRPPAALTSLTAMAWRSLSDGDSHLREKPADNREKLT